MYGFRVTWNSTGSDFDYFDKSEMEHLKCNVDSTIKRGISDYCPCYKKLEKLSERTRNLTVGTAAQAAFAFIRAHESVKSDRCLQNQEQSTSTVRLVRRP